MIGKPSEYKSMLHNYLRIYSTSLSRILNQQARMLQHEIRLFLALQDSARYLIRIERMRVRQAGQRKLSCGTRHVDITAAGCLVRYGGGLRGRQVTWGMTSLLSRVLAIDLDTV